MSFASRRSSFSVLVLLSAVLATGCVRRIPEVSPAEIPGIRQQLEMLPEDLELRTRLGIALHNAGEYAESAEVLEAAVEDGVQSGAAFLYLGLSHEALENWSGARQVGSSRVDLQACKLEYSIVSPK